MEMSKLKNAIEHLNQVTSGVQWTEDCAQIIAEAFEEISDRLDALSLTDKDKSRVGNDGF